MLPPYQAERSEIRADWIGFYDAHFYRVVRFVMHNGANLQDAEDAAQQAFTESWVLMATDPARWAAIAGKLGWIRVVALRRFRRPPGSRIRPQLAEDTAIPDFPRPDPWHDELTVQAQTVLQALRRLEAKEERPVMAFYLDGFSAPAIAAALSMTEQRVRDVKKKAREKLKRAIASEMIPGGRESR